VPGRILEEGKDDDERPAHYKPSSGYTKRDKTIFA
jgi:hypothetical protein